MEALAIEGAWLVDNAEAHVVLLQLPPLSLSLLKSGESRPAVLNVLTQLLGPLRRLEEMVTQGRPAIVLLPELAVAFRDWATIDALVRAYPHPVILITGFSFTSGEALVGWANEANSITDRKAVWHQGHSPSANRVYNGGWCWIHKPNVSTTCIAFQKITAEQREERKIPNLDTGQYTFCLELDDLVIFPVICSDLLAMSGGQRVIASKIESFLAQQNALHRKVLVAGLLAQNAAHADWRRAIVDVARGVNTERVNVCVVNWAYDILVHQEHEDRWRDFSGVYVAGERQPSLLQMQPMRRFKTEELEAAIARSTEACVLGGPMRWAFNSATTRHVWAVNVAYSLDSKGDFVGQTCESPITYELVRFIQRQLDAAGAPSLSAYARVALTDVRDHLLSDAATPTAEQLICTSLFGCLDQVPPGEVHADNLSKYAVQLDLAIRIIGALRSVADVVWQESPEELGQLENRQMNASLLVWNSPERAITVKQRIDGWKGDVFRSKPLVIFSNVSGSLPLGYASNRRRDIGSAPSPQSRSIAEAVEKDYILQAPLDELSDCLHIATVEESIAALSAILSDKLSWLLGRRH